MHEIPVCPSPKGMVYSSSGSTIADHNRHQVSLRGTDKNRHHVCIRVSHACRSRVPTTEHARYTRQQYAWQNQVRTDCIKRNISLFFFIENRQLYIRPIEIIAEIQLCELCDTSGTSVGRACLVTNLTKLHTIPRSAVNKELAYFYHHIKKLELTTILILRHSQKSRDFTKTMKTKHCDNMENVRLTAAAACRTTKGHHIVRKNKKYPIAHAL